MEKKVCPVCALDGRVTKLHKGACWMHGTIWRVSPPTKEGA